MNRDRRASALVSGIAPAPHVFPSLQPLLQSLMSTLANMDFEYEQEREQICVDPRDGSLKMPHLAKAS